MDEPLLVEIIAYAPTAYYHCTHCEVAWREMGATNRIHKEQMESSLPKDLINEYQAVSDWVQEVFRVHCDRIAVKMIDAASLEGFYKSLKYNARRYPAIRQVAAGGQLFRSVRTLVHRRYTFPSCLPDP